MTQADDFPSFQAAVLDTAAKALRLPYEALAQEYENLIRREARERWEAIFRLEAARQQVLRDWLRPAFDSLYADYLDHHMIAMTPEYGWSIAHAGRL